jgi:hypothetical protein
MNKPYLSILTAGLALTAMSAQAGGRYVYYPSLFGPPVYTDSPETVFYRGDWYKPVPVKGYQQPAAPAAPSRQAHGVPSAPSARPAAKPGDAPAQHARPLADKPSTPPPPATGGQCIADDTKKKTSGEIAKGASDVKAAGEALRADTQKIAQLVTQLRSEIPACNPSFADKVREGIDTGGAGGKPLPGSIQDIGAKAKDASSKLADSLQGARGRYDGLDFCSVNACSTSFGALGSLFSPVAAQANASLKVITDLRTKNIDPAKAKIAEVQGQLVMVIQMGTVPEACNAATKHLVEVANRWDNVQRKFNALETRMKMQSATATKVAQSASAGKSCGAMAQK